MALSSGIKGPSGPLFYEGLRRRIEREEFDYQMLLDALQSYSRPRDKISDLLRKGVIIRVKKGLYVFGEAFRKRPYSRELLANLIHGPSYISLEYALQFHGLIPERVETVTSVILGRSRAFVTPVGRFTFRRIPRKAFPIGMSRVEGEAGIAFLIAVPEKALSDYLAADRGGRIQSEKELGSYLLNSLRLDPAALVRFDSNLVEKIADAYGSRKIRIFARYLKRLSKIHREDSRA
jgi:hypothetical protein